MSDKLSREDGMSIHSSHGGEDSDEGEVFINEEGFFITAMDESEPLFHEFMQFTF